MEHYHIIKKIGSGSYGDVWKAITEKTNEVVAIKKLKRRFRSVEECINLREFMALRKMKHPNIVTLKQMIIEENGTVFMVFQCMECSLYNRLIEKKYFSEAKIKQMCFQIFKGLEYMHEKDYFHRDLKPENLLVSGDVIKIADLGLARKTNGKPPYTDNVGSLWYRAPESLLSARRYDPAVDMWAMGVIMAELFTGKPLFEGDSAGDQLYEICSVIGTLPQSTWNLGFHLPHDFNYRLPELPGVQLSSLLPSASPLALNLIATLLSWNPFARPTAKEALEHPFFYTYNRDPPLLKSQPIPVVFIMAAKREIEMEKKRMSLMKASTECSRTDSEKVDAVDHYLINLLPENPFY